MYHSAIEIKSRKTTYRTRSEYASTLDFSFRIISMGEQMASLDVDVNGVKQSSRLDDKLLARWRLPSFIRR